MRQSGATYRHIAEVFELSICRVRQIIEVETAREAAGIYPPFDWNEWNRQNMEKLAKKKAQDAAGEAEYWAIMGKELVRGINEGIKEVSPEYEKEAADDSLCKDNSRQVQAASGSGRQ